MLVWIKVPCVAVGVLASFVLLLSTVVTEQVDLNVTSDNSSLSVSASEESETLQLMHLPFASSLSNPCSWDSSYTRPSQFSHVGHRAKFIDEFYIFVSHYARIYKEDVQDILRNHTISGCADLHVGTLPYTPTLAQLQEMNMGGALNKIYSSLLVHSAYSYFVHHQVYATDLRCSNDIEGEQSLANQSYSMALKQKALACYVRVGMTVLGYEQDDITPLLSERISDLSQCSRRALRDCQVLNSSYKFLEILQNYAAGDVTESSASSSTDSVTSTTSSTRTNN